MTPATIHSVRASFIGGFFVSYNLHKRQNSDFLHIILHIKPTLKCDYLYPIGNNLS